MGVFGAPSKHPRPTFGWWPWQPWVRPGHGAPWRMPVRFLLSAWALGGWGRSSILGGPGGRGKGPRFKARAAWREDLDLCSVGAGTAREEGVAGVVPGKEMPG